ncbi:hypothetical protein [Planococcus sp. 107-1]|uniref:hypothetical protein n=1 Tax=Planococcus sp. 107-1 TaxID=2908840 RepID=UPI001F1694EF|nr:hypothetical protein [Planococcus sp. 107-1]UJF26719.1 hypothetical protein L0M13_16530 [Planococcus sp. 107-1]
MNLLLIAFSFMSSMFVSGLMIRKQQRKIRIIVSALLINTAIIGASVSLIYSFDHKMQSFGVGLEKAFMPLMAIPVLTWLNAVLLPFVPIKISPENR